MTNVASSVVDALVLAGGINNIELYPGCQPGYKALLQFAGRPAICYTLEALRASGRVARICVVGSEADLKDAAADADCIIAGCDTLMGSIVAGLKHFAGSAPVLIATADLPLLTAEAVASFLEAADAVNSPYEQSLWLSVVPRQCYAGPYAGFSKGFNRFRDVAVCHGNLALADPGLASSHAMDRINRLYGARKSPLSSAMAIGMTVGLSYILGVHLLHLLTLSQMSAIASRRFGVGLLPVVVDDPAVAVDVDEPRDYQFVTERLAALASG